MNRFLESISPLNHAAEIRDPVMITAGKNDPRVPVGEIGPDGEGRSAHRTASSGTCSARTRANGFRRLSDEEYQVAAEAYFFQTYLLPEKRLTPLVPETAAPVVAPTTPSGPD